MQQQELLFMTVSDVVDSESAHASEASGPKKASNANGKQRASKSKVKKSKSKTSKSNAKPPGKAAKKKLATATEVEAMPRKRIERPYPRVELREAVKVSLAIRQKNGGHPWDPENVREAVEYPKGNDFYYLTAASRDFGLTEGTRDTTTISLTELGKRLAYAETPDEEAATRREAFFNIEIYRQVVEYYSGADLPEMKYLKNTLENKFHLDPTVHEEFADLFRKNCEYLNLTEGVSSTGSAAPKPPGKGTSHVSLTATSGDIVTVAEPEEDTGLVCFVEMPFSERDPAHVTGFFHEVLNQIIAPAGRKAGFKVITARKQGSDVIMATIVNGLLDADLVVADLTEHNPNVLFELGMRMNDDKPVALIRASGTKAIFDVDNMLRVEEYNPCLWKSSVEVDMPRIAAHIRGAWESRTDSQTYMKILRNKRGPAEK
jgi:hypothetical protein